MNIIIRAVEGAQLATFRAWAAKYPDRVAQRDRLVAFMEIDLIQAPPVPVDLPPEAPEDQASDRLDRLKASLVDTIETMKAAMAEASALVEAHEVKPAPPVVVEPAPVEPAEPVERESK